MTLFHRLSGFVLYRPPHELWVLAGLLLLGLGLAYLPLLPAIVLVGGTGVLIAGLIRPYLALYILIPIIPFSSLIQTSIGGIRLTAMEGLLALMLGAWLLKMLAQRTVIIPQPPLLWPFLVFLGAVALSWLNTFSVAGSLIETAKWLEMLALYLFIMAAVPQNERKWLVVIILLSGAIQAGIGLYQFVFRVGPEGFLLFEGAVLRAYGTFNQPNPFAGYLGLVIPLALALSVVSLEWLGRPGPSSGHWQVGWLILGGSSLVIMVAGLYASQSRGGLLAFAGGVVITLLALGGRWIWLMIAGAGAGAGAIAFGGLALLPAQLTQRFSNALPYLGLSDVSLIRVTDANFSTIERLAHWQAAREMWRDHFWFGVGFGNYERIYPAYAVGPWENALGHAHNYLLNLGAETGFIGLLAYLVFWAWVLVFLFTQLRRRENTRFDRAMLAGTLGIIAHLHLHNMLDNLFVQGMYLHLTIVLALATLPPAKKVMSHAASGSRS